MATWASKVSRWEAKRDRLLAQLTNAKAGVKRYQEQGYEIEQHRLDEISALERELESAYDMIDFFQRATPGTLQATRE